MKPFLGEGHGVKVGVGIEKVVHAIDLREVLIVELDACEGIVVLPYGANDVLGHSPSVVVLRFVHSCHGGCIVDAVVPKGGLSRGWFVAIDDGVEALGTSPIYPTDRRLEEVFQTEWFLPINAEDSIGLLGNEQFGWKAPKAV